MGASNTVTLCGRHLDRLGHICAFFDSLEEQYEILTPYYLEGIEEGDQVINIVDRQHVGDHRARLVAGGVPVAESEATGGLRVLASEDVYTAGGRFGASRMYDLLHGALADAQRSGRFVRASGVMDWALRGHAGTEQLMDYEARVNVLVPIYECTLLCVYDLSELSGRMVMDILATHPLVIHRREIVANPHYRPPLEMLGDLLAHPASAAKAGAVD